MMSTLAGTGVCGFGGDGGSASEAQLNFVSDVALDGKGSLYVAEPFNCRVRRVELTTGIIDTAVGDGSCDYNGEGIPAARAGIDPWGVAVGPDGALYIADSTNCRVRAVRADRRIETLAGTGECGFAGDGAPAREAMLFRPYDVVVDQLSNVYVTDVRTFTVRKIDGKGAITTVAGVGVARPVDIGGYDPTGGLLCSIHNLPIPVPSYLGDGGPSVQAGLYFPYGIALDYDGHLYIADTFDHRVRRVTCGGSVPCAGPAAMTTEPASSNGTAIAEPTAAQGVSGLPSTGDASRTGGSNPAPGLLGAVGAAVLLAGAARLPRASISRRGRGERRGDT
jgi:DNA-binding beta-propeller fold protein YncE